MLATQSAARHNFSADGTRQFFRCCFSPRTDRNDGNADVSGLTFRRLGGVALPASVAGFPGSRAESCRSGQKGR